MRIQFEQMKAEIKRVMLKAGLPEDKAEVCAQTHTETSCDGVYSHGLNRVPRFFDYCQKGWVNPLADPTLLMKMGNMENYDGNLGVGITNAKFCAQRAVDMAKESGMGIVTLKNTTHWMRGGTYAWDIANQGMIAINWTNTESCMPTWGSKVPSVGNNPLCIGVPREEGNFILDMAMSQYSYGKLQVTRLAGKELPYAGGFDKDGNLTSDPGAIEQSQRILPTGYWKGSGLAIVLDLVAAIMSGGLSTAQIDKVGMGSCGSCAQVFIALNPTTFSSKEEVDEIIRSTVEQLHNAEPVKEGSIPTYPGERTKETREKNLNLGIEADETVWADVCSL